VEWWGQAKLNLINERTKIVTTKQQANVTISPPNFQWAEFLIRGNAPYVQNKFSTKARQQMKATQEAGSTAKTKTKKEPKNFQEAYQQSLHKSTDGWYGMPAPAFRAAMISACRTVGFKMTLAKLSIFVEADGFDEDDATPLVKILKGEPEYFESLVRVANNAPDIHARGMWRPGWEAQIRIRFDGDQFTITDITNLMLRVGLQVGIGEGRPDSKMSTGMGWGTFEVINREE
jgi:hypothetical protein